MPAKSLIKKYTLHIFAIRAINMDTVDLPQENNAFIVCTGRHNKFIDALPPQYVLQLPFPDFEDETLPGNFNETHAETIVRFVQNLPGTVSDLYVCCDKGGSRSPAVAAALLRASGRSDRDVWRNPFYVPNMLVYRRLCRAFGLRTSRLSVRVRAFLNEQAFRKAQKNKGSTTYERWQILE